MPNLRTQSFQDLRQRFAAGAKRHPMLRCAMAQTTDLDNDADLLLRRAWMYTVGCRPGLWSAGWCRVKPGKYERLDTNTERILEPGIYWSVEFSGDKKGRGVLPAFAQGASDFLEIAEDAGVCLPTWDEPEIGLLPTGFREGEVSKRFRWLFFVFHLAWTFPRGTPLRAGIKVTKDGKLPLEDGPTAFACALPMNPFLASVAAIDVLLEILKGNSTAREMASAASAKGGTGRGEGDGNPRNQTGAGQGGTNRKRRRGRKPGAKTADADTRLYRDWKAAHDTTGITKAEFIRERGLPDTDLSSLERGRGNVKRKRSSGRKRLDESSQEDVN
jgi:hypothetical protein